MIVELSGNKIPRIYIPYLENNQVKRVEITNRNDYFRTLLGIDPMNFSKNFEMWQLAHKPLSLNEYMEIFERAIND